MRAIRLQFCPDMPEKEWFKDNFHFVKRQVLLWPAGFIHGKGFTLPPERFKGIIFEILNTIKGFGDTDAVKCWPAYLGKCVQSHFKIHWEEYYNEAKAIRGKVDAVLFASKRAQESSRGADPVEAMAMANRALRSAPKRQRPIAKTKDQLSLF